MKYQYEFSSNPEYMVVHVSERLTERLIPGYAPGSADPEQLELLCLLQGTKGVTGASLWPYSVAVTKGVIFSRDEVLDAVKETLQQWFSVRRPEVQGEWVQLPTLRSDITGTLCPECLKSWEEEESHLKSEEIRRMLRDLDTLEWWEW